MEERKIITKTAAVCENGHIISGDVSEGKNPPLHCEKCGGVVYTTCPTCGKEIPGNSYWVHYDYGVPCTSIRKILTQGNLPKCCDECSEPYPWANTHNDTDVLSSEKKSETPVINIGSTGDDNTRININSTDTSRNVEISNAKNNEKRKNVKNIFTFIVSIFINVVRAFFH